MDAATIGRLEPMLEEYLGEFDDCFGRSEPAAHFRTYVNGQLSDVERKNIERIADRFEVPARTLQQFLSRARWDDRLAAERVAQIVARDHGHRRSIGVIDETSDDKKGVKTPGVKRQYSGSAGKVDNCVVSVHLSYVAGDFHVLLPGQLFLPQEWSADRDRCREAGIPDEVVHRPKWQIALEQRDWAVANGVRLEWLAGDEGYGRAPAFLFALDDRGQRYVLEVPSDFHVWSRRPEVLVKEHHGAEGTRRRRVKVRSQPTREVRDLVRYSPAFRGQRWETFHVKDTTRGPVVWEAKAAKVYLKRDGRPTWPHWLVVARNVLDPEELRYWVSNAAEGTPLEVLLHVGFQRYHVESCFEEEKGELGLDHCEVRNYRSLQRHYLLTSVSHLFLAKARAALGEKKPGPDGLPGASGDGGLGPLVLAGTA